MLVSVSRWSHVCSPFTSRMPSTIRIGGSGSLSIPFFPELLETPVTSESREEAEAEAEEAMASNVILAVLSARRNGEA
jgi:hypothetical protein